MSFTFRDLVKQFDPAAFARGEQYARTGKVLGVRQTTSTVAGQVDGSGSEVYRQTIKFKVQDGKVNVFLIESRGRRPQSHSRRHRHSLRSLVEPRQRKPGHRPRLAHRSEPAGVCL